MSLKKDDESLQEAYERMYTQWLKMYATNRALNSEIQELRDLKTKAEGKVVQLEALLAEKDEYFKSVVTEFERTQKTPSLLNNDTSKLDHLITTSKSFDDHCSVGYKGVSSSSKTMFVKSPFLVDSISVPVNEAVVKFITTESKSAVK